ncbi:MAG: GAF domain-containing sensor histidine kinase [Thermoleophilaceae bacterium]
MARTVATPPRPDSLPWNPVEALGVFVELLAQVETATTDASDFYDRLCEATAQLAHLSRAVIFVWDEGRQRVRAVGSKDVPLDAFARTRVSPANVPIAHVALAEDRVVEAYDDFHEHLPPEFVERLRPRNLVCTPMSAAGIWVGVIMAEHKGDGPLTEAERHTLWVLGKVAALAASARIATRQQERSRQLSQHIELAREVHDSVMQRLFAVGLVLEADATLAPDDRDRCADQVHEARQELAAAMQRPLARTPAPAAVTLGDELAQLEAAHANLRVESDWHLGVAIPPRFEALAQNILAEALRNARKHAWPTRVRATVKADGEAALLEVVNDGCDGAAGAAGMGLRLAAQDATNRGAELQWGPLSGERWIVRLRMPLEAASP